MGHGTSDQSALLSFLYHRRSGLVLKCRVDDTIQSTQVLKNKVPPNLESHMRSHGLCHIPVLSCHSALPLTSTRVTLLGLDFFICIMGIMGSRILRMPTHCESILVSSGGSFKLGGSSDRENCCREALCLEVRCLEIFHQGESELFREHGYAKS